MSYNDDDMKGTYQWTEYNRDTNESDIVEAFLNDYDRESGLMTFSNGQTKDFIDDYLSGNIYKVEDSKTDSGLLNLLSREEGGNELIKDIQQRNKQQQQPVQPIQQPIQQQPPVVQTPVVQQPIIENENNLTDVQKTIVSISKHLSKSNLMHTLELGKCYLTLPFDMKTLINSVSPIIESDNDITEALLNNDELNEILLNNVKVLLTQFINDNMNK